VIEDANPACVHVGTWSTSTQVPGYYGSGIVTIRKQRSISCGRFLSTTPCALSLAADISDPEIRSLRIENVARRWLQHEPAAAETALIHSDLPAALVSRLLR